jgi:dTDP-4-dehydrorhamnose reductase
MEKPGKEKKLLVLGASGFIGLQLIRAWGNQPMIATYRTRPIPDGVFFDAAGERLKDRLLRPGHRFTHAIVAHGMTNLEQCARMRPASVAINVTGTLNAIDDLRAAGVHTIFLSSDAVFDGSPGLRSEADEPSPVLSYGRDKRAVEVHLEEQPGPWTILRLTKVIAGFPDRRNLLSEWLAEIERGQPLRCATDQMLTPVDVAYVARAILFIIETGMQGAFHIAGSEAVTRHSLAHRLLAHLPRAIRDQAVVHPCSIVEFSGLEQLPRNCALSNAKFVALSGMRPRSVDELCAEFGTSAAADRGFALRVDA